MHSHIFQPRRGLQSMRSSHHALHMTIMPTLTAYTLLAMQAYHNERKNNGPRVLTYFRRRFAHAPEESCEVELKSPREGIIDDGTAHTSHGHGTFPGRNQLLAQSSPFFMGKSGYSTARSSSTSTCSWAVSRSAYGR